MNVEHWVTSTLLLHRQVLQKTSHTEDVLKIEIQRSKAIYGETGEGCGSQRKLMRCEGLNLASMITLIHV